MNHGHVTPNSDGSLARCGGPSICSQCALELGQKDKMTRHKCFECGKEVKIKEGKPQLAYCSKPCFEKAMKGIEK